MFFIYSELINNMKIEVRDIYEGTIGISVDKDTEIKLYDIFGTGSAINIQMELKDELNKLGLAEITNKYIGTILDEPMLCNLNKDIYRFMEINKYEIYNKLQLILFKYNPMERYYY